MGEAGSCWRRKDGACKLRRLGKRTWKPVAWNYINITRQEAGEGLDLLMQETENHCAVSTMLVRMQERRSLDRKVGMAYLHKETQAEFY